MLVVLMLFVVDVFGGRASQVTRDGASGGGPKKKEAMEWNSIIA